MDILGASEDFQDLAELVRDKISTKLIKIL